MNLHAVSDTTFLNVEGWHDRHFITDAYFIDTLARYRDYPYISERFVNTGDSLMTKMYFSYHTRSAIKPDRKKFVVAAYCGFVMQIFDIGTNSIDLVKTLYLYEPIMDDYIWGAKDCVKGPVDVAATDKYIYVLYGDTPELSAETIRMGVFDWNGKPVVHDRMHWTLAEAINTSSVLFHVTDNEKYAADYAEFMKYLDEKVLDHVNGSWFHQLDRENNLLETVWPGKSDIYHALQATLIPYYAPGLSIAVAVKKQAR